MVELNSNKETEFPDFLAGRHCQSVNTLSRGLTASCSKCQGLQHDVVSNWSVKSEAWAPAFKSS